MYREAIIIDGKSIAQSLSIKIKHDIDFLRITHKIIPGIVFVLIGNNLSSNLYVENKVKACTELGISSFVINLPETISEKMVIHKIQSLNHDPKIHAILIQLPIPKHINTNKVINSIDPAKDVDGFHPLNLGKLVTNQDALRPCTPIGCMYLLKNLGIKLTGLNAVVVGRSNIVGIPMGQMLMHEDCTLTYTHSKTKNLKNFTQNADILIVATGKPGFITSEYVKNGAIVIDVGISRIIENNKTVIKGDVDFANVKEKCYAITPVPGGVGPMTIISLMSNTVKALCLQKNIII